MFQYRNSASGEALELLGLETCVKIEIMCWEGGHGMSTVLPIIINEYLVVHKSTS